MRLTDDGYGKRRGRRRRRTNYPTNAATLDSASKISSSFGDIRCSRRMMTCLNFHFSISSTEIALSGEIPLYHDMPQQEKARKKNRAHFIPGTAGKRKIFFCVKVLYPRNFSRPFLARTLANFAFCLGVL